MRGRVTRAQQRVADRSHRRRVAHHFVEGIVLRGTAIAERADPVHDGRSRPAQTPLTRFPR